MATPPREQQSAILVVLSHDAHTQKGARKVVRKVGNNGFGSLRTSVPDVRNVRSGRQHGTVRANHDVQVRFQR